jgi:hypothetical protein
MTVDALPIPLYEGTVVTSTVTFVVPPSTEPIDPVVVTLKFRVGKGPWTTWTYGGVGYINKTSDGIYFAELDTTGLPGQWTVIWEGTVTAAAVQVRYFAVTPQPS